VGRILVTGGAGFIGSAFARYALSLGSEVVVLDNLSTGQQSNFDELLNLGIHCVKGDIRDSEVVSEVLEGCQFVVHLAAKISVPESIQNPEETMDVNVKGTQSLIDQCNKHNIKRFILASSAAVYGNNQSLPLEENDVGAILSPYAESKLINEEQISQLHSINCQTFALRFFNVYGNGQCTKYGYSAVIPTFIKQMSSGSSPTVHGNGTQSRDFVHVDDVCRAIFSCLEHDLRANMHFVMNVATGNSTSLVDLIGELNGIMSSQDDGMLRSPEFVDARCGDILHSKGCIERISKTLGWKPSIQLKEGLTRMILQVRD
jgi:nucleoside-diphosphate-sugar epimerase